MNENKNLPYDPCDAESIVYYAQQLVGSTLREKVDVERMDDPKKRKGAFGNLVENAYFLYDSNSDSAPDFSQVGMELKTTPLKQNKKGDLVSKERLVIGMIDYMSVTDEEFETSHLLEKSSDILLISYLYEAEKDPLDYLIKVVARWGLPEDDMPIFKNDWELVVDKIRAGEAHLLSGSDTLYLEACTKAANSQVRRPQPYSDIPAKPRAWALKNSYMTSVSNELLEKMQPISRLDSEANLSLFDLVHERFSAYFGLSEVELAEEFGYTAKDGKLPKNIFALVTNKILGVDKDSKIAEFEKAGIKPKTVRIKRNKNSKESMSFPTFDYCELAKTDFEDSEFSVQLDAKYLFVIFREDETQDGVYRLRDIIFWQMNDIDKGEAAACYEEMRRRVNTGQADNSVKSSENRCCHVRPHGQNANDTCMTPYGVPVTKKCFWLNAKYLAEQIEHEISKRGNIR